MGRVHRGVSIARALMICTATVLCCLLLYAFDNKYTADNPQAKNGVLVLSAAQLSEYPTVFLVDGWEYYANRLLTPADFQANAPAPDEIIYIGQYGGFDRGNLSASPHGSASYRLRILLPNSPRTYLLELPEIFSSYRLYVNGVCATAMGNPDPSAYRPATQNRTVSIEAAGEVELLFAVSDFSHLYSGMVYPPAFGQPEAVLGLLNTRLVFRSLLVTFAFAVALLSVLVGVLSGRGTLAVLYGLLCLCFVGYTVYPILRTLFLLPPSLYAVENLSFCAMLLVTMLVQQSLHGRKLRGSGILIGFGAVMCLFSASLPLLLPMGSLKLMGLYSLLVTAYQLSTAAFLTVFALQREQPYSHLLLCGFLILDTALVMDRVLPLYEPIVTGWFVELASFAVLLCIGAAVGQEVAGKYREIAVLAERQQGMERLVQMQQTNYTLLMEKVDETKAARHDLRHHFMMIDGFLKNGAYDRLADYVAEYEAQICTDETVVFSNNMVVDVLLGHYARQARAQKIDLEAKSDMGRDIGVADADLCAVLSNLLENAVEACANTTNRRRWISITLTQQKSALSIYMVNTANGSVRQNGDRFISTKAAGRTGYGLSSICAIANRYNGAAAFEYDRAAGVFSSTVLLILE